MELHLKEENSILGDGQFRLRCVAWAFLCRKKIHDAVHCVPKRSLYLFDIRSFYMYMVQHF